MVGFLRFAGLIRRSLCPKTWLCRCKEGNHNSNFCVSYINVIYWSSNTLVTSNIYLGRYSEEYGIIGDIIQSHIFQTIALLAMEPPISLDGEDIRNEKVYCAFFKLITNDNNVSLVLTRSFCSGQGFEINP